MSLIEPSVGLFDTSVELDVIERGLRRGLGTTKRCGKEKSVHRIGENQGFFSRVGVLQCNWPEGCSNLPNQVVIKITTLLNTIAMNNRNGSKKGYEAARKDKSAWTAKEAKLKKWHNNEILFYEDVQALSPPPFVPRMYCGKKFDEENRDVGFVCMEFADSCTTKHIYDVMDKNEIEQVLSSYAELQSVMHELPSKKKEKYLVSAYDELYADILNPSVLSFRLDELREMDPSMSTLITNVEQEATRLISTKIAKKEHIDLGMEPVFVHGDMYSPNFLWRADENGQSSLYKIVDWQFCHFGSAAEDLSRLFISSTSSELRRANWEKWLQYYHDQLKLHMSEVPFTLDQLSTSYRHFFVLVALAFLGTVPEIYKAAMQTCSKDRDETHNVMMEKVKGILEDVLFFAHRKQG